MAKLLRPNVADEISKAAPTAVYGVILIVVALVTGFNAGLLRSAVTILAYLIAMPVAVWAMSLVATLTESMPGSPWAQNSLLFFAIFRYLPMAGNVIATSGEGPYVALTAHMDTVLAPKNRDEIAVNANGTFRGPGISDNGQAWPLCCPWPAPGTRGMPTTRSPRGRCPRSAAAAPPCWVGRN